MFFYFMHKEKTITIPKKVLERMHDALDAWREAESLLEDFILTKDKSFIQKVNQARKEHQTGKVKSLAELKKKMYGV